MRFPWHKVVLAASVGIWLLTAWNWAWDFSQHALQMDLASFYVAGESLRLGLDPYVNNYPVAWTGADLYHWSGFLYAPFAAFLFQGLAFLPYHTLKTIWSFLSPIILVVAGWIIWKWLKPLESEVSSVGFALFLLTATCAFPMKIEIERGQIDLLLLLITMLALFLVEVKKHPFLGGVLLGILPFFKLHIAYLLPYFLLRRHRWVLVGSIVGFVLIGVLQTALYPALTLKYIKEVIPRTSRHGNIPPASERLNTPEMPELKGWNSVINSHGRVYLLEGFDNSLTASNASLARFVSARFRQPNLALASLMLWATLSLALIPASIRLKDSEPQDILAFWLIGFDIMLLSAPLTWSMAVIWLLPAAFVIPWIIKDFPRGKEKLLLVVIGLTLLFLCLDERPLRFVLSEIAPFLARIVSLKYVVAEIWLGTILWVYLQRKMGSTAS